MISNKIRQLVLLFGFVECLHASPVYFMIPSGGGIVKTMRTAGHPILTPLLVLSRVKCDGITNNRS